MNYIQHTLSFQHVLQRDEHEHMLSQLVTEAHYILNQLNDEDMFAVSESVKSFYEGVWDRIKEFFKNILEAFSSKAKSLFISHEKWWKENEKALTSMDFKGLSVEVYPYHAVEHNEMMRHIATVNERITKEVRRSRRDIESRKTKSDDAMKDIALKGFLNADGELIDGLKTFYRSGGKSTTDAKPITLADDALKSFILQRVKPFVMSYKSVESVMRAASKTVEQNLKVLEREIGRRDQEAADVTKEYFSVLDDSMWTLTEETNAVKSNATQTATKSETADEPAKPDMTVKRSGMAQGKGEITKDDTSAMSRRQLAIFSFASRTFQQMFSVMLTINEERLSAYMTIAKGALSAGKKSDTPEEETKKEEKAN